MKVKITHIHPDSGFYPVRDKMIGLTGLWELLRKKDGWEAGLLHPDDKERYPYPDVVYFSKVKVVEVTNAS